MKPSQNLNRVISESEETLWDVLHYGLTVDSGEPGVSTSKDGEKVMAHIQELLNGSSNLNDAQLSVCTWARILQFDVGAKNRQAILVHLLDCSKKYDW